MILGSSLMELCAQDKISSSMTVKKVLTPARINKSTLNPIGSG